MKTLTLFASQRLIEFLSRINHEIPLRLNECIKYGDHFQISYLDFGSTNDTVSYITYAKYTELVNKFPDNWRELVWNEKRSEIKIGKLIKMLFKNQFPINIPKDQVRPLTLNDIESFVNMFKAESEKGEIEHKFELVSGDDIHYWYSQDNYSEYAHEDTTLGRSCLRYNESSIFLKMYSMNPHIFRLLILKDDFGRLKGRAIVWNLHKPENRVFMDRVYSVNDYDVELFKNYAREQKWLYKEIQTYGWNNRIVDTLDNKTYEFRDMLLSVKLDKFRGKDYEHFPYLDTLSIYNKREHSLCNDGRLRVLKGHYILSDYRGAYIDESYNCELVYSSLLDEYIPLSDSKYADIDDTWVFSGDVVYVSNAEGKYAYYKSKKICKSRIYKTKFFLKKDCVYSKYLGTYVFKESARTVYLDKDKKSEAIIHYKMIKNGDIDVEEIDGEMFLVENKKPRPMYSGNKWEPKNDMYIKFDDYLNTSTSQLFSIGRSNDDNPRPTRAYRTHSENIDIVRPEQRPLEDDITDGLGLDDLEDLI